MARQFEKTLALLNEIQSKRLEARQKELEQAANLVQMNRKENEPYDPAEDGFVFSKDEIHQFLSLRDRRARAAKAFEYCNPENQVREIIARWVDPETTTLRIHRMITEAGYCHVRRARARLRRDARARRSRLRNLRRAERREESTRSWSLHAFSGDAHAAGEGGWWTNMIGPGKAFDTDQYFVICSNVLGGCRGTTGPGSINPETGCPWAMTFPSITISDMVRLAEDADRSSGHSAAAGGLRRIHGRDAGARMGGGLSGERGGGDSDRHYRAAQRAADRVQRSRAPGDHGRSGLERRKLLRRKPPARGLAVARMVGHITYMSDESMREKFGRRLNGAPDQFEVESYLQYRGNKFVDRFDANSYIYITRAMDSFDLTQRGSAGVSVRTRRARDFW